MNSAEFLSELVLPLVSLFVNAVADAEVEMAARVGHVGVEELESALGVSPPLRGFSEADFRDLCDSAAPTLQEHNRWKVELEVPIFTLEGITPVRIVDVLATEIPDEFADLWVKRIRTP